MSDTRGLTEAQQETLTAVLDCLIPPDPATGKPGAGELGLAAYVTERLGQAVSALVPGLTALDTRATSSGSGRFAELAPEHRSETLEAYAADDPGFLPGLLFHVYCGYYQQAEVLEGLGMEGRPPHPKGYELGPDDPSLLDPVRARGAVYRRA